MRLSISAMPLRVLAACVLLSACGTDQTTAPPPSYTSSLLAGTWAGQAGNVSLTLQIPSATCSQHVCGTFAFGTTTVGSAQPSAFASAINFYDVTPATGPQLSALFATDTLGTKVYAEQLTGSLTDATHIAGAITVWTPTNPSLFGVTDSLAITLTRQ